MVEENLDVVGYWTEIKLNILEEYVSAYSKIMYFASHNKTGEKIVLDIFKKYSNRGAIYGR